MSPAQVDDPRVQRTRAAVVDTAVALLVEGGVGAVTIEAIVRRSGVARSTIYRHWPSRTDVVAAAFGALMVPLPDPPTSGDLRARLTSVLRGLAHQMMDQAYASSVPSILDSAARDPDLHAFRRAFTDSQTRPLRQILDDAVAAGDIAAIDDVDGALAQLVGPLLFRRIVFDQSVGTIDVTRSVQGFLAGLLP